MDTKTYNVRSNARRAARKELGNPSAEDGADFTTVEGGDGSWTIVFPPAAQPAADFTTTQTDTPTSNPTLADMLAAHPKVAPLIQAAYDLGAASRKPPRVSKRTGPTKREQAAALLTQKGGTTSKEILALTHWPAVSIPALAKASGLTLTRTKEGNTTRYFGKPKAPT